MAKRKIVLLGEDEVLRKHSRRVEKFDKRLRTLLEPQELLDQMHVIEQAAHRERLIHWGPRTLDLDLLLYDQEVFETETLIVPHVEMHLRDFVLQPMAEIAPNLRHPILKKTMTQLLAELTDKAR